MRIGIDATCWWNQRGFGRFTRLLLRAMFAEGRDHAFCLFVDREPPAEMIAPNVRVVRVRTSATVTDAAVADDNRKLADLLAFRSAVAGEPLDVMYFPAVYSWYPTGERVPTVVTFHDAIAEHFPALVMPSLKHRMMWNAKIWLARRSAARITTVSKTARDEIVEHLGIARDKIDVILEAADPIFAPMTDATACAAVRTRLGLPPDARVILYVGGIAPHKNLLGLLKGFAGALAHPALDDVHLVFVGDPKGDGFHSNADDLVAAAAGNERLGRHVHFTGFVSDADLVTLYSDAMIVAMPAFSEGFGLPAAEAMACGTPVMASRGGAVEEIVGPAGLFFDPHDIEDIASVIVSVASDQEKLDSLRAACLPRAAEMSWPRAANAMLDVLERVARR